MRSKNKHSKEKNDECSEYQLSESRDAKRWDQGFECLQDYELEAIDQENKGIIKKSIGKINAGQKRLIILNVIIIKNSIDCDLSFIFIFVSNIFSYNSKLELTYFYNCESK